VVSDLNSKYAPFELYILQAIKILLKQLNKEGGCELLLMMPGTLKYQIPIKKCIKTFIFLNPFQM